MKGLEVLPNLRDFENAYNDLQSRRSLVPLKALALYSQWARLDPRFAEILVEHLAENWMEIPIGALVTALRAQPWPRAMLVLFRFVEIIAPESQLKMLKGFIQALESSLDPMPVQLFFIPLQRLNSVTLKNEVDLRTAPYTRSGFVGSQSLLRHSQWPQGQTFLDRATRASIRKTLLDSGIEVTVADYQRACGNLISRRQAQRDLVSENKAKAKGYTRGRRYRAVLSGDW